MRVLCVAEKPSIAKSISQILSGGQFTTVSKYYIVVKAIETIVDASKPQRTQPELNISRTMNSIILKPTLCILLHVWSDT